MRTRMYGGVGGRKTKVGRKLTFVFLLPDFILLIASWLGDAQKWMLSEYQSEDSFSLITSGE